MAEKIVVSTNTPLIDGIQAAARYAVVIVSFIVAVLGLLKTRDIAGMITLVQDSGGQLLAAVAGLVALGTAGYGVFKTSKRSDQLVEVIVSPKTDVPGSVAEVKK
jgi:hypothetical protein